MSAIDAVLTVLILAAAVLAVRSAVKRRKSGGCGCGCAGCTADCPQRGKRE